MSHSARPRSLARAGAQHLRLRGVEQVPSDKERPRCASGSETFKVDAIDDVSVWVQRVTRHDAVENLLSGTSLDTGCTRLAGLLSGAWTMASAVDVSADRPGAKAARHRRCRPPRERPTVGQLRRGARAGLVHALANRRQPWFRRPPGWPEDGGDA
jgi:hypothetical protein